jgi:hypothetical protein
MEEAEAALPIPDREETLLIMCLTFIAEGIDDKDGAEACDEVALIWSFRKSLVLILAYDSIGKDQM